MPGLFDYLCLLPIPTKTAPESYRALENSIGCLKGEQFTTFAVYYIFFTLSVHSKHYEGKWGHLIRKGQFASAVLLIL